MGVVSETVVLSGPVRVWRSSAIGERGFCEACGSSVWHRPRGSERLTFGQGLFDDQQGWRLSREIFADRKPSHYGLSEQGQKAFTAWGTLAAVLTGRLPR